MLCLRDRGRGGELVRMTEKCIQKKTWEGPDGPTISINKQQYVKAWQGMLPTASRSRHVASLCSLDSVCIVLP